MKKAIVTGANGFIGSALLQELTTHDIRVCAVIRNRNENINSIKNMLGVEIVYCEMEALHNLPDMIKFEPDVFYHLAWAGVNGVDRGDYILQLENIKWTLNAVNIAKKLGCKRFVSTGTLAEFDVNAYSPLDGSKPNKVSCYGVAKIAAHLMSKAECNAQGIEHLWAYLPNTYGIGNFTLNFINFAAKIMITGQSADFTSGEQLYDFVYINDVTQGLYCIGENGKENYAYYIGSTKPKKLKEFITLLRDEIDPEIPLNFGAIPFRGVKHPMNIFDCTHTIEDTGYMPQISFQDGIKITVEWLRQQIKEGRM